MSGNQELIKQLVDLRALKNVTEALTEVSSAKVKGSRDSVLQARDYYNEISKVYYEIKLVYQEKLRHTKNKVQQDVLLKKNGKKIALCLTSNIKFTREMNESLVRYFIKETGDIDMERVIIGHFGEELLKESQYKATYRVVSLGTEHADREITKLLDYVVSFSDIYFFHNSFRTLLDQEPALKHISYDLLGERLGVVTPRFIFEPSLDKIIQFFETEILRGLFQQSFYESDLSQYAKQLVTVEESSQKADALIKKQKRAIRRARFADNNAKQISVFAGFAMWNKK